MGLVFLLSFSLSLSGSLSLTLAHCSVLCGDSGFHNDKDLVKFGENYEAFLKVLVALAQSVRRSTLPSSLPPSCFFFLSGTEAALSAGKGASLSALCFLLSSSCSAEGPVPFGWAALAPSAALGLLSPFLCVSSSFLSSFGCWSDGCASASSSLLLLLLLAALLLLLLDWSGRRVSFSLFSHAHRTHSPPEAPHRCRCRCRCCSQKQADA